MIAALPDACATATVASFAHSYRYLYLAGAAICGLGLVLAFFIKELPLRSRLPHPPQDQAFRPSAPAGAETARAVAQDDVIGS